MEVQFEQADGTWETRDVDLNAMQGMVVEVKAYGFVTNPGDPGWVDPLASPEVQAQQLALRRQRAAEWTEQAKKQEGR